MLEKLQI